MHVRRLSLVISVCQTQCLTLRNRHLTLDPHPRSPSLHLLRAWAMPSTVQEVQAASWERDQLKAALQAAASQHASLQADLRQRTSELEGIKVSR